MSASILKAADLRRFSLPLDWARSGGAILPEILRLEPEIFYQRHIASPNIRLVQAENPSDSNSHTAELSPASNLYGYPYYYNPHRRLDHKDKGYYLRCLERFKFVLEARGTFKHFLLSDLPHRTGENFFGVNVVDCIMYIDECIASALQRGPQADYDITICRIIESNVLLASLEQQSSSGRWRVCQAVVPRSIDCWNKIVGRMLYPGTCRSSLMLLDRQQNESPICF
jgi:hypothetical protein